MTSNLSVHGARRLAADRHRLPRRRSGARRPGRECHRGRLSRAPPLGDGGDRGDARGRDRAPAGGARRRRSCAPPRSATRSPRLPPPLAEAERAALVDRTHGRRGRRPPRRDRGGGNSGQPREGGRAGHGGGTRRSGVARARRRAARARGSSLPGRRPRTRSATRGSPRSRARLTAIDGELKAAAERIAADLDAAAGRDRIAGRARSNVASRDADAASGRAAELATVEHGICGDRDASRRGAPTAGRAEARAEPCRATSSSCRARRFRRRRTGRTCFR